MPPKRLAIVGTGNSVGNHLTAIQRMGDRVELVAAVDVIEARVQAVSSEHGIPHWYTDIRDMLSAEQPDLVHLVTPPAVHKAQIIECLNAGAWVFCEKPLCASLAEFDELSEAEAQTGNYLATVFQWRTGSAANHVKKLIQTGILGKPLLGICNTLWYRAQPYFDISWRGRWASEFGGPTMTLGIHLMDLFLWLYGDWQEVRAMMGTLNRAVEYEDVSMALVRFESGAMGSIVNSVLSPRQESRIRLDFEEASIEVTSLYRYSNDHWTFTLPDSSSKPEIAQYWASLAENIPSGHDIQLREILDAMDRGERPAVSGYESRRVLEFVASLYKSAMTGKPVLRGEITPDDPFYHAMNGVPLPLEQP